MTELMIATLLQMTLAATPVDDYANAFRQSQETSKPLLVLVGAEWCPACTKMNANVLPELKRRGLLDELYFAKVNIDHQETLTKKLTDSTIVPQLILYKKTGKGWRRWNMTGQQTVKTVENFLSKDAKETVATRPEEKTSSQKE